MLVDTRNVVPVSEVSKAGLSRYITLASDGTDTVITNHGRPVAALVGIERAERLTHVDEIEEDLRLLALALARLVVDDGTRVSLDDILAAVGLDRSDLVIPE